MESFFSKPRKSIKLKYIESYILRERYQSDIALFPNYKCDWFINIFTMMDHFTKYGWVIPLNHSKAETILTS